MIKWTIISLTTPQISSIQVEIRKKNKEDKKLPHKVKLPIKISADGDDSRANVTNFEMRGISHFDNNVEAVLESLSQLRECVIKPKGIEDQRGLEDFPSTSPNHL